MDETYTNPPSNQQLENMATAPPLADDHAFRSASLLVPNPSALSPSYKDAVGPADKTFEEESKQVSGQDCNSSFDDQSYTPRFKNEPRTWESDPSNVITNTQPGTSTNRTTSEEEVCTDEECMACCLACVYCGWLLVEILAAFNR